ncbi:sulfurtransferase TusA family protein [Acidiferrobacter thiooxydans]|uniref:sulfurtransferase TusA family protein n=1 Tax=Acidiferrobacter thiooxydans TaxID=163359 RepID=UPI0008250F7A|nr:sulfurtransferase TusA family protein [Acidiferrobacter thiooxydans]MDA8189996.1 sulfurtransferase TusA family protein [Gammaproteobacteria bacterium]UEO00014.1 sulfurtransferase TusA family protein [Acidiferrobacter thiooxydans]
MDLDARYLLCPMPVIRVSAAIGRAAVGDTLTVHCTDPGALHDIPAWCRLEGHEVVAARTEASGDIVIVIRVGGRG